MATEVILHAGQHKTGSTSIQQYVEQNQAFLIDRGIAMCPDWSPDLDHRVSPPVTGNAKAIANAIIRNALGTPLRVRGKLRPLPPEPKLAGLQRVNAYLRSLPQKTVIVSAEALSFLREPDEMRRIDRLCEGMTWRAIMFLREPKSWLESWKTQLQHSRLIGPGSDRPGTGIFDLSDQSWLVDHAAIRAFWGSQCRFLSYEQAVSTHGSVVPAFLAEIGLNPSACPPWEDFYLNPSEPKRQSSRAMRRSLPQ